MSIVIIDREGKSKHNYLKWLNVFDKDIRLFQVSDSC